MYAFARGARTGVRTARIPSERNTSSKAAVNVLSRSWIKNRIGSDRSTNVSTMFRACWEAHSPVGVGGQLDEHERIEATEQHRVDGEEVAGDDPVGLCAQAHAPPLPRPGAERDRSRP